jgi:hypothetical protein
MRTTSSFLLIIVAAIVVASFMASEVKGPPARDKSGDKAGGLQYRKTNMHLCPEGKWALGQDKWGKIVRVNMRKIAHADRAKVPGVKKAWPMTGYEGVEGMAFRPVISDRMLDATTYKKNFGGTWRAHAMPGGHEGVRHQVDLGNNGRADVIMPFGECHWGSDSILFLMEGRPKSD